MKKPFILRITLLAHAFILALATCFRLQAAPAPVIFHDDFEAGISGWTAIQPPGGNYIDGPMLWVFDKSTDAFSEQSNLYTDSAGFSVSRIASMLIRPYGLAKS